MKVIFFVLVFSSCVFSQHYIDVDGDDLCSEGDTHTAIWWIQAGGDLFELVTSLEPLTGGQGFSASAFFGSDDCLLAPIGIGIGMAASSSSVPTNPGFRQCQFLRGDANSDGVLDIADTVAIAQYASGVLPFTPRNLDALDVNDDGQIDLSDSIAWNSWYFQGGLPFPEPFPFLGSDPTLDGFETCCDSGTLPVAMEQFFDYVATRLVKPPGDMRKSCV